MSQILIVEDDRDTMAMLSSFLERHGYQTASASNGWEALIEVDKSAYDLILLDIMMPGLDGAKFLSILRDYAARLPMPVLVVTALQTDEAVKKLPPQSPDGVVEKKGEHFLDDLLARIHKITAPMGGASPPPQVPSTEPSVR